MTTPHEQHAQRGFRSWGRTRWMLLGVVLAAIVIAVLLLVYTGGGGSGGGGGGYERRLTRNQGGPSSIPALVRDLSERSPARTPSRFRLFTNRGLCASWQRTPPPVLDRRPQQA